MERLSGAATRWTGTTPALMSAIGLIVVWLLLGPLFHYSDTWQLVINTTTTIVTFLMVFLIQRTQNKDASATSLKLNELIAALDGASNRLIQLEDLSEAELQVLHQHFVKLAALTKKEGSLTASHSVEEAEKRHRRKQQSGTSR
jgi:low affinity Fe/Cu permease